MTNLLGYTVAGYLYVRVVDICLGPPYRYCRAITNMGTISALIGVVTQLFQTPEQQYGSGSIYQWLTNMAAAILSLCD